VGGGGGGGEQDEFGDALGGAHDAVGVDCLVGGDVDELLGAVGDGGVDEGEGAEGVGLDGSEGVLLHEGDVLEGRGMEDDLGLMLGEGAGEGVGIGDAGEEWRVVLRAGVAENAIDLVESVFGVVEEEEAIGVRGVDGGGEGRADGAACSGDEDAFAG
jgi:hypothetical protein